MIIRKIWEDNQGGTCEKLLVEENETETIALGYVAIENGDCTNAGFHDDEEEIYVVLKGRAMLTVGNETCEVSEGSVAYVPRNKKHFMKCISDEKLEYLYFANWPGKSK